MNRKSDEGMIILTVSEVKDILGVSRQAVHKRIDAKNLTEPITVEQLRRLLKEEEQKKGEEYKKVKAAQKRLEEAARKKQGR